MGLPGIGVVVTCFNLGRTLRQALTSVQNQTRPPSEVLVVDDGSTDVYTRQVLANLSASGTTVIRTPNAGVSAARNLGVRKTEAPYVVLLDADDWFEDSYFEAAAEVLDREPEVAFVSCGMRSVGGNGDTWVPPPPTLTTALVRPSLHISTMCRRGLWDDVGGFDESFEAYEEMDFWARVLARGHKGVVLDRPLLNYRIRQGSMARRALRSGVYEDLVRRFYAKREALVRRHAVDVLLETERFLVEQREHHSLLIERNRLLQERIAAADADLASLADELRRANVERVDLGDLRRLEPLSTVWGMDRGKPLDRHYIERFLLEHAADVHGAVLEVKDAGYTRMVGADRVTHSDVVDVDASNSAATIIADISVEGALPRERYDCIILTQTLGVIYDVNAALAEVCRALKPGGVLLCTLPAAGRIDYELGLDGDFWRFTDASVRRLFASTFPPETFEVRGFGNVLAATAFLQGMAPHELRSEELEFVDPYFPVLYAVRARKPQGLSRPRPAVTSPGPRLAVLMYHRVATPPSDRHGLCVSPSHLRAQLRQLRSEGFVGVTLEEAVAFTEGRVLHDRCLAVTFDDGYADALQAMEIMADAQCPATFFVVDSAIAGGQEFWWDLVEWALTISSPVTPALSLTFRGEAISLPVATQSERERAHDHVSELCRMSSKSERNELIRQLRDQMRLPTPSLPRRLSVAEVVGLSNVQGVAIGAHSSNHLSLRDAPDDVLADETLGCKARLEQALNKAVTAFAYPYGAFDQRARHAVHTAGFRVGLTCEPHCVQPGTDRLAMPRIDASRIPPVDLLKRILDWPSARQ